MKSSEKPKSILWANRFFLVATLIQIINILVHYGVLRDRAISDGSSAAGPMLGIIAVGLYYILFGFFIYRRGSNIAKWVVVALTASSVISLGINMPEVIAIGTAYAFTDGISFVLQITAVGVLFRQDAVDWLKPAARMKRHEG